MVWMETNSNSVWVRKKRPTEMRAEAKDGFGQVLIELEREKP